MEAIYDCHCPPEAQFISLVMYRSELRSSVVKSTCTEVLEVVVAPVFRVSVPVGAVTS